MSMSLAFAAMSSSDSLWVLLNRTGEKCGAGEQHRPTSWEQHTFHPLRQKHCYLTDLQYKIKPRGLCLLTLEEDILKFFIKT